MATVLWENLREAVKDAKDVQWPFRCFICMDDEPGRQWPCYHFFCERCTELLG